MNSYNSSWDSLYDAAKLKAMQDARNKARAAAKKWYPEKKGIE